MDPCSAPSQKKPRLHARDPISHWRKWFWMQLYSCWCHPTSRLKSLSQSTKVAPSYFTTIHLKWSVSWCNVPALSGNRSKNPRAQKTLRCWLQAIKDRVWLYTIVFHAVAVQLSHGPIPGAKVGTRGKEGRYKSETRLKATWPWWKHIGNIVGVLFVEDLSTLKGFPFWLSNASGDALRKNSILDFWWTLIMQTSLCGHIN